MNFDKSTGIIEMFMDSLEVTDEGTFTFDLVDGKARGRTSLVLIGEGKRASAAQFDCSLVLFSTPVAYKDHQGAGLDHVLWSRA